MNNGSGTCPWFISGLLQRSSVCFCFTHKLALSQDRHITESDSDSNGAYKIMRHHKASRTWYGSQVQQGSPRKAVGCESNVTALLREAALFVPGYEYFRAIPRPRQAILTALYRDTALFRPPFIGGPLLYTVYKLKYKLVLAITSGCYCPISRAVAT